MLKLSSTLAGLRITVQHAVQAQHDSEGDRDPCATSLRALPQAQNAPTAAIFIGGHGTAEESSAQAQQARESAQILNEVRHILRYMGYACYRLCLVHCVQSADSIPQCSTGPTGQNLPLSLHSVCQAYSLTLQHTI